MKKYLLDSNTSVCYYFDQMKGGDMKDVRPKCPECKSTQVMTTRAGLRWCRRCGHEWNLFVVKKVKV
jgi:ribosomal protein L37AE/L43A